MHSAVIEDNNYIKIVQVSKTSSSGSLPVPKGTQPVYCS